MKRLVLALGVAVAAAAIALVVLLRHHDETPVTSAAPPAAPVASAPASSIAPGAAPKVNAPMRSASTARDGDGITLPNGDREYTLNGVRVRQHNPRPPGLGSLHRAPQYRPLPPAITDAMIEAIRDAVATCASQVSPDARTSTTPHADAHVELSILDGRATITTARFSLRGADSPEAITCMQQHAMGTVVEAPGVPNEHDYPLALTVTLP